MAAESSLRPASEITMKGAPAALALMHMPSDLLIDMLCALAWAHLHVPVLTLACLCCEGAHKGAQVEGRCPMQM